MRTCFLSISDKQGGAAIAGFRLFEALLKNGMQGGMLVQKKLSQHPDVEQLKKQGSISQRIQHFKTLAEYTVTKYLLKNKHNTSFFSTSFFGNDISRHPLLTQADVIHLNWINLSYLNLDNLESIFKLNKPVIWLLHDMWAFTGGCHYNNGCPNYLSHCQHCPCLRFKGEHDLSSQYFDKKMKLFADANLTIVTPSNWLTSEVKRSKVLAGKVVHTIPNHIDTLVFTPKDQLLLKQQYQLNLAKKHILFGAMNIADHRKGFFYLKESLLQLAKQDGFRDKVELVIMGKYNPAMLADLSALYSIRSMGYIHDTTTIADLYALSDAFIIPTLEDNLPNTVLESLASGTPVVAFETGGIPDMVKHNYNGYVAHYKDVNDLSEGIYKTVFGTGTDFRNNARTSALENFSEDKIVTLYTQLYKTLIA